MIYNNLMNNLTKPDDQIAPAELLKIYIEWGVDETITEEPINWFSETDNINIIQNITPKTSSNTSAISTASQSAPLASQQENIETASKLADSCKDLGELNAAILEFDGCSLKKTASNILY